MTWGGPSIDHGDSIGLDASGHVVIGGTAEGPPYTFQGAPMRVARDKAVLRTPNFPLISVDSGVVDAGGVVATIAGTTNDDPGIDAAFLVIAP